MKEIIVHCPTKELLEKVKERLRCEYPTWEEEWTVGCGLRLNDAECRGFDDIKYYKRAFPHTPIISAQEYLQEPKKKAYYKCPKCGRKSGIVHLDKKCPFCEKNENQPFEDKSAEEQGIDISRYFTVVDGGGFFEEGVLVKFAYLKEWMTKSAPIFEEVGATRQESVIWSRLRYATQSEIDAVLGLNKLEKNNMSGDYFSNGGEYLSLSQPKPINQSIIKKTMNSITNYIKNATLSAEEKLLRENGLKDSCGNYTEAYEDVRDFLLNQEYETKVVEQLKKKLEAEKEK
jgi:hypothetical protein